MTATDGWVVWDATLRSAYRGRVYASEATARTVLSGIVWHARPQYEVRAISVLYAPAPAEARHVLALDAIRDVLGIDYDEDSAMWHLPAEPAPIECATLDDALRAYAKMAVPASGEPSGAEAQYRITGAAIRDRRTAAGLSLRELAAAVGISNVELGEIERGRLLPDADTASAIREAINAASGSGAEAVVREALRLRFTCPLCGVVNEPTHGAVVMGERYQCSECGTALVFSVASPEVDAMHSDVFAPASGEPSGAEAVVREAWRPIETAPKDSARSDAG